MTIMTRTETYKNSNELVENLSDTILSIKAFAAMIEATFATKIDVSAESYGIALILTERCDQLSFLEECFRKELAELRDLRNAKMSIEVLPLEKQAFLKVVPNTPREQMTGLDRLKEEGLITWQVSVLMDRLRYSAGYDKRFWPKEDTDRLQDLLDRLHSATLPPSASPSAPDFTSLDDDALSRELRHLEDSISSTRKMVSVIHAIRNVRHNAQQ